ncbi:hypothetical protein GCM10028807_49810 [Spirosoma daeguense]
MTASDFIRYFSAKTWFKIQFARKYPKIIRLGEVTITQNLILSFALWFKYFSKSVYLFEAKNEKANGNDIELFIRNKRGKLISYPCQAKIVDKKIKEVYSQINHSSKSGRLQIDALLNYSKRLGGIPIYVLYNYSKEVFSLHSLKGIEELYGCSYVPAAYLKHNYCPSKTWKTPLPTFKDLHPLIGKPFFCLFELGSKALKDITDELIGADNDPGNIINWTIKEYTLDELQSDRSWRALDDFENLEDSEETPILENEIRDIYGSSEDLDLFAPKYRIIIN